jgi:hypothetical protein
VLERLHELLQMVLLARLALQVLLAQLVILVEAEAVERYWLFQTLLQGQSPTTQRKGRMVV